MENFDIIIVGGGATGLGCALEAATRGYKTLLLEAYDYGSGTSSKSTKLVHGGIRYLANLDFALVKEGLEERFYFLRNAPHLAHTQSYLIPFHNLYEKLEYHIGIRLYDFLAGKLKIGKSRFLSRQETLSEAPDLNPKHINGGGIYYDGQFDDTRMLVALLRTFESLGGVAFNYHRVIGFIEELGRIAGVQVQDTLNNKTMEFKAKVVINATGIFSDALENLAEPSEVHHSVEPAQGTHLVFDKTIFACEHAFVIPKTVDGRILFVLPWHDKVVVGTTDVAMKKPALQPIPSPDEIDLILSTFSKYTSRPITRTDIKAMFAGQRPLVKPAHAKNSKKISRKHEIFTTSNGLVSIVGGKWTIYRRMGEDTINFVEDTCDWPKTKSITRDYPLYGADKGRERQDLSKIEHYVQYEQAKTVEDVLARRTRLLFLDAKAAMEVAPSVAKRMADCLQKDDAWVSEQIAAFNQIAAEYLP